MPPDPSEVSRYHRQQILPGIGAEGQRRIERSHAIIVGCGALGTVIADALARAGVGRLTIIDRDVVEWTNLQRQVLFDEEDARQGTPKSIAAAARLGRINSSIHIEPIVADLNPRNAERLILGGEGESDGAKPDLILDGTDNFHTRYLLNDLAVKHGIPYVYGGVVGTHGMAMTFVPSPRTPLGESTPCLRCVFPDPPAPGSSPTCDTAGVLGPAAAVIANLQATDAIKLLVGESANGTLTEIDLWRGAWRTMDLSSAKRHDRTGAASACPCCQLRRFDFLDGRQADDEAALCGANAVQVMPLSTSSRDSIDLPALAARLQTHGDFTLSPYLLRGRLTSENRSSVRQDGNGIEEAIELSIFRDGRAIIRGTTDPARARSLYARFVGA